MEEICRARFEDEDLAPWEQIEEDVLNAAGFVNLPLYAICILMCEYKDLVGEVLRSKLVGPSILIRVVSPIRVLAWASQISLPRCLKH